MHNPTNFSGERRRLTNSSKRWLYAVWLFLIAGFAVMHALNLLADFPNHSPWYMDWAKYTDEGWWGNAAIRAHLTGHWYLPGDFNPAPVTPVLPFLEWVLFFFTGVTVQAARGLAVAFFFANLLLSYLLLRSRGSRWMALLAVTLLATSPFLYCFSRLAILEPLLIAFALGALNLAVRLPRLRRPMWASVGIGLLFTLMLLTKTTAVFLLPALLWAMLLPFWQGREEWLKREDNRPRGGSLFFLCALTSAGSFAAAFGVWMALIVHFGLLPDYKYLFFVNKYPKPPEPYWPLVGGWWSFHGGLWVDHILIPLAGVVVLGAAVGWRSMRARRLLLDPVFGASILAIAGYLFFMTIQNHPQPRYFAVVAFFCFFLVALGVEALLGGKGLADKLPARDSGGQGSLARLMGWAVVGLAVLAAGINSAWTLNYAAHPEFTLVDAARRLTEYIDNHPNGNRLLVSISGDQITLITHLPTLCDDFGAPTKSMPDLPGKLAYYQPGWYATWNDLDPGTLEDLHTHFSLEQVASFRALDDRERNVLVLFKLHPLPGGQVRNPADQNLQMPLPDDKIEIPIE